MRVLILADPVEKLRPAGDTSLAIAEAFFNAGDEVDFTTDRDLAWVDGKISFSSRGLDKFLQSGAPQMGANKTVELSRYDAVLIRKDPPFDQSYVKLLWLLAGQEKKILISNRPSLVLRHHEKLLPQEGVQAGFLKQSDLIQTCFASSVGDAIRFAEKAKADKIVLKPFYGFAGSDVILIDRKSFAREVEPYFKRNPHWIVQPFEEAVVRLGDCRVFFIHGKFCGGFARMPKSGGFVSNLAQGGSAAMRDFSKKECELIRRVEKWSRFLKLDFVGADLIGAKLNEMNITSPTGFRSYEKLTGIRLAEKYRLGVIKKCQR